MESLKIEISEIEEYEDNPKMENSVNVFYSEENAFTFSNRKQF